MPFRFSSKYDEAFIKKALQLEFDIGTLKACSQLNLSSSAMRKWRQALPHLLPPGAPSVYPRGRGVNGHPFAIPAQPSAEPARHKPHSSGPMPAKRVSHSPDYDPTFIAKAVRLSEEIGVFAAARELSVNSNTLRNWGTKKRQAERRARPSAEVKIQRAARRAPLRPSAVAHIAPPPDITLWDMTLETAFERGFRRGYKAAIDLIGTEEGATDE